MSRDLAVQALKTDQALTAAQLSTYYGIHPRVLTGLGRRDVTLAPRKNWSRTPVTVRFYALEQKALDRLHPAALGHYAGAAAMRYQLKANADQWQILRSGSSSRLQNHEEERIPDAIYVNGNRRIAVEYDSGTYSMELVGEKLDDYYLRYDATIWGATSKVRRNRIRKLAAEHGLRIRVINPVWWSS